MQGISPRRKVVKLKSMRTPSNSSAKKTPISLNSRLQPRKPSRPNAFQKLNTKPLSSRKGNSSTRAAEKERTLPLIGNDSFSLNNSLNSSANSTLHLNSSNRRVIGRKSSVETTPKGTPRNRNISLPKSQDSSAVFETLALPISPATALQLFIQDLTSFEQGEVLEYPQIFFLGLRSKKLHPNAYDKNYGYDDERSDYKLVQGDHIAYRYEVIEMLGKGSFGQVCRCFDHKEKVCVAVKVIRNKKRFHKQGVVEVRVLDHIVKHDKEEIANAIFMKDKFLFRNHLCITFELLSINLYELMKSNSFQGFSLGLIRRFAIQILCCLKFTYKHKIIHCDLKPENILLKQPNKSGIKVIDFGSSCFETERIYTYIQSRFYRAPEIMLGIPYTVAIDMWSVGCILGELFTGYPLFPGEREQEQLLCIMEVLGLPSPYLLSQASRKKLFFDKDSNPRIEPNSRGRVRYPGTRSLKEKIRCSDSKFLNLVSRCLDWDPETRITPDEALAHEWILEGFGTKC